MQFLRAFRTPKAIVWENGILEIGSLPHYLNKFDTKRSSCDLNVSNLTFLAPHDEILFTVAIRLRLKSTLLKNLW